MRLIALILAGALAACASSEMRPYVGRPIQDVLLAYGAPEQVIDMPDGRKAYQFRWGGGTYIAPGSATSVGSTVGGVTHVTTTSMPAVAIESEGCLIAFLTEQRAGAEVVAEIRPPRETFC